MITKKEFLIEHVTKLIGLLGVENANVDVLEDSDLISVSITGEDLGHFIGYHGENINALQSIFIAALLKNFEEVGTLAFDIEGYRLKREERVRDSVREAVEKVIRFNKPFRMFPMSGSDRRIVHMEISDKYPDLISYSVGEGIDRRVIISKSDLE